MKWGCTWAAAEKSFLLQLTLEVRETIVSLLLKYLPYSYRSPWPLHFQTECLYSFEGTGASSDKLAGRQCQASFRCPTAVHAKRV